MFLAAHHQGSDHQYGGLSRHRYTLNENYIYVTLGQYLISVAGCCPMARCLTFEETNEKSSLCILLTYCSALLLVDQILQCWQSMSSGEFTVPSIIDVLFKVVGWGLCISEHMISLFCWKWHLYGITVNVTWLFSLYMFTTFLLVCFINI